MSTCPKRIEVASDFPPPVESQDILSLTLYYTEMSPCKQETCRLRNKLISSRFRLTFTDWMQILTSNVTAISKKHNTHLSPYYGKKNIRQISCLFILYPLASPMRKQWSEVCLLIIERKKWKVLQFECIMTSASQSLYWGSFLTEDKPVSSQVWLEVPPRNGLGWFSQHCSGACGQTAFWSAYPSFR